MPLRRWSTTPANNSSTPPFGAPEGWAFSAVNDWARQTMADLRSWYEDPQWVDFGHSTSFVSAASFKTTGVDTRSVYTDGRRIKAYVGAGSVYGDVLSSTFAGGDTTITVTLDAGALDSSMTSVAAGILTPSGGAGLSSPFAGKTLSLSALNVGSKISTSALNVVGYASLSAVGVLGVLSASAVVVASTLTTSTLGVLANAGVAGILSASAAIVGAGGLTVAGPTSLSTVNIAAGLSVSGAIAAAGNVGVAGALSASSLQVGAGGIGVAGNLSASAINAVGTISGSALVAGAGGINTAGKVSASALNVSGATSLASLVATGNVGVAGALSASSMTLGVALPIASGGTGASSSGAARTSLGVPPLDIPYIVAGGTSASGVTAERFLVAGSGISLSDAGAGSRLEVLNVAAAVAAATQAEEEAGSLTNVYTSPGRQHFHPSSAKAWFNMTITGTVPALSSPDYNCDSVTDNGVGDATIVWTTDFSSAVYTLACIGQDETPGSSAFVQLKGAATSSMATTGATIEIQTLTGTNQDTYLQVTGVAFGDHV